MTPIEYAGVAVVILEAAALAFLIWAWFRDKRRDDHAVVYLWCMGWDVTDVFAGDQQGGLNE